MTVDFQEHFWGDKQNGFDILYQNLKCGSTSAKELADFLRIRTGIEEYNFNLLIKLSRKTSNAQFGTFQPLWTILKSSTEKLSSLHMQTLQRLNQLIKEVTKYCEDHHKKQKQIKTEENPTIEAINELKETIAALNKAKEFYYAKTVEVERLKRENASQKDIEKAEIRVNKACGEYKTLIEKYRKNKDDYEKKFRISCKNFQKLEEDHLRQMKEYLASYFQILESGHTLIGQVHKEFQNNCKEMTSDRLLEMFIKSKGVGAAKPADIQFEEANPSNFQQLNNMPQLSVSTSSLSSKPANSSGYTSAVDLFNLDQLMTPQPGAHDFAIPSMDSSGGVGLGVHHLASTSSSSSLAFGAGLPSTSSSTSSSTLRKEGFLRSKKTKESRRNRNSKKDSEDDDSNNGSISGSKMDLQDQFGNGTNNNNSNAINNNNNNDYMIDAEGYTVRPVQAQKDDERFYSSSDTESESEDEKEKKIFVKINPLKNGAQISASVDQLIASAGALTLAPPSNTLSRRANLSANPSPILNDGAIKRSVSASQSAFGKPNENDLFDIFHSQPPPSNGPVPRPGVGGNSTTGASSFASSYDPLSHLRRKDSSAATELAGKGLQSASQQPQLGTAVPAVADRYAAFSDLLLSPSSASTTSNTTSITTATTIVEQVADESKPPPLPLTSEPTNILPLPPKSINHDSAFTNSFNNLSSSSLAKSLSSTSIMGTTPFSVYKPSLSKSFASSTSSNGMMSRAESISSLSSDFHMTPISLSSRDPSPLTIGMSDTLPIAIAFQESIGACFKGTDENLCKINVIGCIKIAFSSGIIQLFSNNPYVQQLSFRLKNTNRLDRIILSKELVTQIDTNEDYVTYEMNMANLKASLRRLSEQSPNARYYNLDMVKYQLKTEPGAKNAPLQMVSYWKCEETTTNLKIDFKFNASAFPHCNVQSLKNVQFTANVDGNVSSMTSQPEGKWDSLTKQAMWKFNELGTSSQADSALGSIKAKFDLISGPTCPSSTYVQFTSTDNVLSGLEFELLGSGYRLSMVKRQFSSGRYYCEPKVAM